MHLLMEVPRRHASALQTGKFTVFQVQTGMICDPEEDVVLSIRSPCPLLSLPKHTRTWPSDVIFPGLVNNIPTLNYLSNFNKN